MDKVLYITLNETNEHLKKIAETLEFFKDAMSKEIERQEKSREEDEKNEAEYQAHRKAEHEAEMEQAKLDKFSPQIGQKFKVAKTSEFIYRDNDYNNVSTLVSKDEVFTVMRYSERCLDAGYILQLMSGTEVWFAEESLRNALKSHALEML